MTVKPGAAGRAEQRTRDPCVVDSAPLSDVLTTYVSRWTREHPNHLRAGGRYTHGRARVIHVETEGVVRTLATRAGVHENTIRKLIGPPRYRTRYTELRVADALLAALERTDLLYDGTFPEPVVKPNPLAPAPVRALCCGSSSLLGA